MDRPSSEGVEDLNSHSSSWNRGKEARILACDGAASIGNDCWTSDGGQFDCKEFLIQDQRNGIF